jgi:hypothetical protein
LPADVWRPLPRPPRYQVQTQPRQRPDNVQEAVVVRREFTNLKLRSEDVAEFNYRPRACRTTYRMVVLRKNLSVERGERLLFDDVRYFFYLTNDWVSAAAEVVCCANDRSDQETLLAQLYGGVRALRAPVGHLHSNWAYMVMTALAWDLKAWWALLLPEAPGRWQERHRADKRWVLQLEFKTFINAFVRIPWLRDEGAALVGIDSLNIDDTTDPTRPVHSIVLRADIPIVEHLTGLGRLPDEGFRFFAVPVKFRGMGTFPVRAFGLVEG